MANRVNKKTIDKSSAPLYWTTMVLTLTGAADAVYLLIFKITGNSHMCLGNGGCHDVNFSPFSEIHGIPVAVFGIAAYLAIACILILEKRTRVGATNGPLVIFGISLGGVAFTVYLTYLELFVIHALCPFCVASAVIITLIFILAIIRLAKQTII